MSLGNSSDRYGIVTKLMHWLIAIAVIGMVAVMLYAKELPRGDFKFYLYGIHKAFGLVLLVLMALRVLWHQISPTPMLLGSTLHQRLGKLGHRLLYIVLFVMPISGMVMSHYGGHTIPFFGFFEIPGATTKVEWLADLAHEVHEVVATVLYVLVAGHIAAAIYHHWICKNETLKRMSFKY